MLETVLHLVNLRLCFFDHFLLQLFNARFHFLFKNFLYENLRYFLNIPIKNLYNVLLKPANL